MHTIVILDPTGAPMAHVQGKVKIINPLYKIQPYTPKGAHVTFPQAPAFIPVGPTTPGSHPAHAGKKAPVKAETQMMGDLSDGGSVF